jgi:hypothetical protein
MWDSPDLEGGQRAMKTVDSLTVEDLAENPVWQYVGNDIGDETTVRPVKRIPVSNLTGRVVGVQVVLSNGQHIWALVGNIDVTSPRFTEHFLTLSIERDGRWFHLARYHDFDYKQRGPEKRASFLELNLDEVFPISYDLRRYAKGDPRALCGTVRKEPTEKLSRAEIIGLAVP